MAEKRELLAMKALDEAEEEEEEEEEEQTGPCWVKHKLLVNIAFIACFFVFGALVVSHQEQWTFVTGMYVVTQIITTVGYGDLTVHQDSTRIFMSFYVLVAIVFVASVVNDIGEALIDRNANAIRGAMKRVQVRHFQTGKKTQTKIQDLQLNALFASILLFVVFALFGCLFFGFYEKCSCSYGTTMNNNYVGCIDRGDADNCAEKGQKKNFVETFYMAIITMTTVGFGDYTPLSKVGRIIGSIWMILGVLVTGNMVTSISATMGAIKKQQKKKRVITADLFAKIDIDNNGNLSRREFLEYMLIKNDMVKPEDITQINKTFDAMDKDGSGKLTLEEIEEEFADDEE